MKQSINHRARHNQAPSPVEPWAWARAPGAVDGAQVVFPSAQHALNSMRTAVYQGAGKAPRLTMPPCSSYV